MSAANRAIFIPSGSDRWVCEEIEEDSWVDVREVGLEREVDLSELMQRFRSGSSVSTEPVPSIPNQSAIPWLDLPMSKNFEDDSARANLDILREKIDSFEQSGGPKPDLSKFLSS